MEGLGSVPTSDARLATVEAVLLDIRGDVLDLKAEATRTRNRLHSLEGTAAAFIQTQKENRRREAAQYQRLGIIVAVVGLFLTLAAVVSPIVVVVLTRK
jgi:hypothetical protein